MIIHNQNALAWGGVYLFVGAAFFGVMCAAFDKNTDRVDFWTLFIGAILWPLTFIAAISYKLAQWLSRKR